MRRDAGPAAPEVLALCAGARGADQVLTTGFVLQELLQGFDGPKARGALLQRFAALGFLQPDREDHIGAAGIRNACRRRGVQIGTIDALLIQLCVRHDLRLLSADHDFALAARHVKFHLWRAD